MDRGSRSFWSLIFASTFVVDFDLDLILFDFSFELFGKFKCKHEILTVLYCVYTPLYSSAGLDLHYFVLSEWVGLSVVSKINLVVVMLCFLQHCLLLPVVLLISNESLFSCLPPNSNRLITAYSNEVVSNA